MTVPSPANASARIEIDAAPDAVYQLITDLGVLAEVAEEATAMRWVRGSAAAEGAKFKGSNRNGWRRWSTTCTVTEAEPGRAFAFDVDSGPLPIAHWRYELTPTATGTAVTESTWDRRPGWFHRFGGLLTGVNDRAAANAEHIRVTLDRLKARAESA